MPSRSATSQWGRRSQAAVPASSAVGGGAARGGDGLRQELAPGADRQVGVGVTDRHVRVGRVRDPQERILQLGLDAPDLGVQRGDPFAGRDRSGAQGRDLGAARRSADLDRLADLLRSSVALRLAGIGLTEERPAARIERESDVHERSVLALVQGALPDGLRLVPETLHPDAHPAASAVSYVPVPPDASSP